jgi:X-X-X-Leu-X-X-Gly heptad repeat protein
VAKDRLQNVKGVAMLDQLGAAGVAQLMDGVARLASGVDQAEGTAEFGPLVQERRTGELRPTIGAEQQRVGWLVGSLFYELAKPADGFRREAIADVV